ncbi:hypothetical protein [Clostridium perfringens]|uniref:hypothetical protein n=1 Tax=Clostridium perfringens TaxID=1502 RepID=UPI001F612B50|nr:hypothetical protein [Clostridium perfringens]
MKVAMVSNGSLIDNEKANMLSKYNINIQFTIAGYNSDLNGVASMAFNLRSLIFYNNV